MSALPSIAQPQLGSPSEAQAAADLYARHSGRIFGYCLGLLRNREEAEDAVQTTFLNAYRGLQRGVRPEFEAAWLFKIAQNVCKTRRESAWRRGRVEAARDLDALQDVVAAPESTSDQAAAIAAALKRMPERYRTIILLREWQGVSYREIASQLELSESAVEMLVFRARRSLAENLEQVDEPRTRALSLSSLAGLFKSLLGGAGLKAAVTAVAVTAAAIAVTASRPHQGHTLPSAQSGKRGAVQRVSSVPRPATRPASAGTAGTSPRLTAPGRAGQRSEVHRPTPSAPVRQAAPKAPVEQQPPSAPPPPTPVVTIPGVSLPATDLSTPAATIPQVELPTAPPPVSTPDLSVPLPGPLHLP